MRLAGHMPTLLERLCKSGGGEHKALRDVLMLRQRGRPIVTNLDRTSTHLHGRFPLWLRL